ncbi:MAG: eukaryotic translation initiation factor 4E [Moraxellaceae bacterium]
MTETLITNQLSSSWTLYYHATDNKSWDLSSYVRIMTVTTLTEAVALIESIPDILVSNGMLFLMKDTINPMWEDSRNVAGGGFSYKIPNKHAAAAYRGMIYAAIGGCLSSHDTYSHHITGITSSQKRGFAIMKIWMADCAHQDASCIDMLSHIKSLTQNGTTFIKHGEREKK